MKINKNVLYIGILIFISLITYWRWLSFNVFAAGDWIFYYPENLKAFFNESIWFNINNLGVINFQLWRFTTDTLNGLFGFLGYGSSVSDKLIIFWPTLILVNISTFLLVKKITRSGLAGFIGAIVFNYSTYYFVINTAFLLYSAAAWSVLTLYIFIYALEKNKWYLFLLSGLTLFLTGSYDFRITYISVFLLGFYFLYHSFFIEKFVKKVFIKNLFYFILQGLVFGLLNLFWVLPLVEAHSLTSNAAFQKSLFGNSFSNILYSITLFHSFWTGGKTAYFVPQTIFAYFWLIPIFAFLGLYLNRKNKNVLFFGILALLGIFLTKQVATPFEGVYSWLFSHLIGFNAFREGSKFYFLIALGYAVLIGGFVKYICENLKSFPVYFKYGLIVIIAFIFLWNVKPILTGQIQDIYVPRNIPKDYLVLRDLMLEQNYFYRTLWIPNGLDWSDYSTLHPIVLAGYVFGNDWNFIFSKYPAVPNQTGGQAIASLLKKKETNNLFNISAIKYVIIPTEDIENHQNIFPNYGERRQYYIDQLDKINWLKKINIGTNQLAVYENENYKSHIYVTLEKETIEKGVKAKTDNVSFKFINPSKYQIFLKNVKESFYLNFADSYNSEWKLRLADFNWVDVLTKSNYFIDDKNHFKNDAGLNSYLIDPKSICRQFACKQNADGSYDISGTLYFAPQSYMYLGLIVSGSTLVIVIAYLVFILGRYMYERKNK